jgi:hypothetical protein
MELAQLPKTKKPQAKQMRRSWLSIACASLCAFAVLNIVLAGFYQLGLSSVEESGSGGGKRTSSIALSLNRAVSRLNFWDEASVKSTIDDFARLRKKPDIVLIGSSVMMFPFWAVDKDNFADAPDKPYLYHHARVFENQMAALGEKSLSVYNFATPLQMVSDSYFFVEKYLSGEKSPELIVFGVTPRDFYDHEFLSPEATLNFRYASDLSRTLEYMQLASASWQEKIDFLASRISFLYDKRGYIQRFALGHLAKLAYSQTANFTFPPQISGSPSVAHDKYQERYRDIEIIKLQLQMKYLSHLALICRHRNIRLVLVNLPLSKGNRILLPKGVYDGFRAQLKMVAAKHSVELIDLGNAPEFTAADYSDPSHMNKYGGYKLIDHLVSGLIGSLLPNHQSRPQQLNGA